jgi:dGTP triphosphohydrolase
MAKSTMTRNRSGNGVDEAATPTPESLDQVRDILFGGQMRMVDARLKGLEERLVQEQMALRNELTRKLEEVEGATRKELMALADRLSAERVKRAEDLKALGAEFKEAVKNLERRHQKLEETAGLADAELRDQLVKQSAALSAELTRTGERFASQLDRAAAALRNEKLDTSTLATALTEMAARLSGNGRPASKGSSRS